MQTASRTRVDARTPRRDGRWPRTPRVASLGGMAVTENELLASVARWWENPALREWLVEKPLQIALTLVVALVGHALLRTVISRAVERGSAGRPSLLQSPFARRDPAEEERRRARIRTLGAVGRSAAAVFIWTWAVLAVLSTLGVNVGPLIASAGVVGVALGFGAQSLVKDFLSGIFMLIEDQYGVGDTIDVGGGVVGEVEDISLRVTTLRDVDGTVWYVRNGEILRVGNSSGEYAIARVEIPVGLSTDVDQAWEVIDGAFTRAVRDPAVRDLILGEPELLGVPGTGADRIIFRGVVKTTPGNRWPVQRHVYATVLADMQRAGIDTP